MAASGGYANGLYLTWKSYYIWELLETVEISIELHPKIDDDD